MARTKQIARKQRSQNKKKIAFVQHEEVTAVNKTDNICQQQTIFRVKCRAECIRDITKILETRVEFFESCQHVTIYPLLHGQVAVEFATNLHDLDKIRQEMKSSDEDTHVMRQTLLPVEEYTGKRNWNID